MQVQRPNQGYKIIKSKFGKHIEIPEDWDATNLAELILFEYGEGLTESERKQGTCPVFGSNGVVGYHNQPLVNGPGIVVGRKGSIGEVTWTDSDFWAIDTTYYVTMKRKDTSLRWLYYMLNQLGLKNLNSATGVPGLNRNEAYALLCPLPEYEEQQKISSILSKMDELIQRTDQVIEQTQRLKKGLTQTLFTKGIGHTVFRKTEIGEIPQEWEIKTIQELSNVVTIGVVNTATPYYTNKDGVPYFRSQNIRKNFINESNLVYVTPEFNQKHKKSILRKNDILTVQTGDIGTSCLIPKKYEGCNCHSLLLTRTDPQELDCNYLCQFLNSDFGKLVISKFALNTGRGHLLLEDFRLLKIPRPSIEEQHRITSILYNFDSSFQKRYEERFKLENLKVGLMQQLLTGKIRVKV